jgi:competence protein ComEC
MVLAITGTLLFALVSGFEPPVVRAWIMGSIIAFGKFYGRKIDAVGVLLFTGLILALTDPAYIYNLSFQLSFLATLSLILFETKISSVLKKVVKTQNIIIADLSATISAQMLIWPFLSYKFGQISLLSPAVNALILWTVPLATMAGSILLALSALSEVLGALFALFVYLPLDFFVLLIEVFSKFEKFVLSTKVSLVFLLVYYLVLGLFYVRSSKKEPC